MPDLPPSAPGPSSERRNAVEIAADLAAPGTSGTPPGQRRKFVATSACVGLLMAFGSWLFTYGLDYFSTEATTRKQNHADEKLDREQAPFTVKSRYEKEPDFAVEGTVLVDRPLSAAEKRKLLGIHLRPGEPNDQYSALLDSLHARTVHPPSWAVKGDSTGLHLDIFSERKAGLAIVDMRADVLKCRSPRAKAVIQFPTEGGGFYDGILFDLVDTDRPPLIGDDDDEHWGKPFFRYKKIDLGNGATPGGLRVEAATAGKSCFWQIRAKYADAEGVHGKVIRNGNKPFWSEAVPERPRQRFEYKWNAEGLGDFVECDEQRMRKPC